MQALLDHGLLVVVGDAKLVFTRLERARLPAGGESAACGQASLAKGTSVKEEKSPAMVRLSPAGSATTVGRKSALEHEGPTPHKEQGHSLLMVAGWSPSQISNVGT